MCKVVVRGDFVKIGVRQNGSDYDNDYIQQWTFEASILTHFHQTFLYNQIKK